MKISTVLMALILAGCATKGKTEILVMPNKGGGEVVITARPCVINGKTVEGVREAYTWTPSTAYQKACWAIVDGMVHVLYLESRERRVYPMDAFREKQ